MKPKKLTLVQWMRLCRWCVDNKAFLEWAQGWDEIIAAARMPAERYYTVITTPTAAQLDGVYQIKSPGCGRVNRLNIEIALGMKGIELSWTQKNEPS